MEVYKGLEATLFISRIFIVNDTDIWHYVIVWQRLVWAWYDQIIIIQCVHFNHPVDFSPVVKAAGFIWWIASKIEDSVKYQETLTLAICSGEGFGSFTF
jgi:hypothetical protein